MSKDITSITDDSNTVNDDGKNIDVKKRKQFIGPLTWETLDVCMSILVILVSIRIIMWLF